MINWINYTLKLSINQSTDIKKRRKTADQKYCLKWEQVALEYDKRTFATSFEIMIQLNNNKIKIEIETCKVTLLLLCYAQK